MSDNVEIAEKLWEIKGLLDDLYRECKDRDLMKFINLATLCVAEAGAKADSINSKLAKP